MPKAAVATQSYQFRIVTGFNRMPVSGNIQHYPGPSAIDGITTAWLNTIPGTRAQELFTDAVGQEAGVMNPRGNIAKNYITVTSDLGWVWVQKLCNNELLTSGPTWISIRDFRIGGRPAYLFLLNQVFLLSEYFVFIYVYISVRAKFHINTAVFTHCSNNGSSPS